MVIVATMSVIMFLLLCYFVWASEYGYRKKHTCEIHSEDGDTP